ncbi:MAG TPA: hypothetical protein VLN08_03310 [Vicinamibacterales bacterium]|nr:hypothetical protein [Vicinamibacterales bacterium]
MRRLLTLGLSLSLLALAAAGCGDDLTDRELGPSGTVTETFAGTLNPGGGTTHVFVVTSQGTISATLTAVGDDNTRVVGLALGNYSNNACQLAAANDVAYVSLPLVASVSAAGTICARVYDSQAVPDATSYTLSVVHP